MALLGAVENSPGTSVRAPVLAAALLFLLAASCTLRGAVEESRFSPFEPELVKGNVALIVGVGEFDEGSHLPTLRYTVNDAVEVAHFFVRETGLIPAGRCVLALSGEPTSEALRAKLVALRSGPEGFHVRETEPTKASLLKALDEATGLASSEGDVILVYLSGHGFEAEGRPYVMARDSRSRFVTDTGLSLQTVRRELDHCRAGKKILIVDTCREAIASEHRGTEFARMGGSFREAFRGARGMAVLMSCESGQISLESESLQHGVFSHFLIEGVRASDADPEDGLVYLRPAAARTHEHTMDWARRNRGVEQTPWFEGTASDIPIALSKVGAERMRRMSETVESTLAPLLAGTTSPEVRALVAELRSRLPWLPASSVAETLEAVSSVRADDAESVRLFKARWEHLRSVGRDTVASARRPGGITGLAKDSMVPRSIDFRRASDGRKRLYVLPDVFHQTAQKNYPAFVADMRSKGYGHLLWRELEAVFAREPTYELILVESGQEEFFRQLKEAFGGTLEREFPDAIAVLETTVFDDGQASSVSLAGARREPSFHFAVYLSYIEREGSALRRRASQADARGADPIDVGRSAAKQAAEEMLRSLATREEK